MEQRPDSAVPQPDGRNASPVAREEEISLAKTIEVTRKRFRRTVIGCHLAMEATGRHAHKVHAGGAALRSHDQGLADRAADQGADPGPHAAQSAHAHALLHGESREDFAGLISKRTDPADKRAAARQRVHAAGGTRC